MQFSTMAGTAVGMAVGAAAVCLATQDQRMMRKTVHKLAKGAEKTLADLDKAVVALHTAFGLGSDEQATVYGGTGR